MEAGESGEKKLQEGGGGMSPILSRFGAIEATA